MGLQTTRFGEIEIDPKSVITLTQPVLGFQEFRRFVLLPGPAEYLQWLQSTDSGELAFLLLNPRVLIPDYRVDLTTVELSELAVTRAEELEVYTLLVVPQDATQVRTNLKAPILLSRKHRLGKQTILERSEYPIQFFLSQAQRGQGQAREVAHARVNP
ncbi:MAG: flagellar assembly protein FliW [Candidatus Hydrogenedentes bacterium]|nr:flagellar assembly protein FliW [Candidatus Hydrogenedentota bacterium]